jgi:hypothetical protein
MAKDRRHERALIRQLRSEHYSLSREHGEVKARVREYTSRRYLTPGEEMECQLLQRLKLQKKDALHRLERRLVRLEAAQPVAETA